MQLVKCALSDGQIRVGCIDGDSVILFDLSKGSAGLKTLADILNMGAAQAYRQSQTLKSSSTETAKLKDVKLLAPVDTQEVWAAGVTYKRSQVARMEESESGKSHYDKVYTAPRPETFFKATPNRVSNPGEPVRVRFDSKWSVPEPEFTLVISPKGELVGYTVGNDMSARDIEGENPLYLPQAKVYKQCCSVGPCVLLAASGKPLDRAATKIVMTIERGGKEAFKGETDLDHMKRGFEELIGWIYRENEYPNGCLLLTGTGIVPPDDFTLEQGDVISIEITGIGTLTNPVVKDRA